MTGFEIAGLLLGLYPMVVDAVNLYKATKTGRAAASLIRKLKTESTIYNQFVRKLLAPNVPDEEIDRFLRQEPLDLNRWQAATLDQKLRSRLGSETANLILETLREIETLLKDLSTELSNIGRGMDVLDKFRTSLRVAKCSLPHSSFQHRLVQLTILNADLNRLLDGHHLPSSSKSDGSPEPPKFLVRDYQEVVALYDFIRREGYDCECDNPHVTNFGLHCPAHSALVALPDLKNHKWDFELVLPQSKCRESTLSNLLVLEEFGTTNSDISSQKASRTSSPRDESNDEKWQLRQTRQRSRSISITELTTREPNEDNNRSFFQDICSFVRNINVGDHASSECLGIIGKTNRRYKLSLKPEHGDLSMDIICLDELLKPRSTFLRKDRMQLALWLTCSILQFYYTGWIDNAWTSKDFCILSVKGEKHTEFSQFFRLFVTRNFYSTRISSNIEPTMHTVNNLWSWYDEPILTKLGFALIELALCQRLSEIRKEQLPISAEAEDSDLLNLQIANKILDSGRLAREESQAYEDVVRVCIKHQYVGSCSSGPKGLNSKDPSFFERAEESIIWPLSAAFTKSWGPK